MEENQSAALIIAESVAVPHLAHDEEDMQLHLSGVTWVTSGSWFAVVAICSRPVSAL